MEDDKSVVIHNEIKACKAEYKEQVINEYKDNAFIEALPPIYSIEEIIERLCVYPKIDENEKNLEAQYRFHIVQRLFYYFQPLYSHVDLENRISRIIRQGYVARNPFSRDYAISFKEGYKMIDNMNMDLNCSSNFRTTASAFTLIGVSGLGKTTAINRILSMYNQVIVHSEYKGNKFSMYQVVWIKLDCPHDGSLKGLCIDFFNKVDDLLGTNYHKKYGAGRHSVNVLLPIIGQVARNIGLGVLVIDEIQHLSLAKSGGADSMLNFFTTLINTVGIPVVLVGTPKAINILQSQFRQARRGSGQGDMVWDRMQNDENWNLLIRGMWKYQWTKKTVELSVELKDILYEESQGITDIAVKIFVMSQIRAISSGKEEISANIIKGVAKDNFKLVKPMLQSLKSGDIKKIAKYEDIYTVNIDEFINNELPNVQLNQKIKEMQNERTMYEESRQNNIKEEAILKLIELDLKSTKAKRAVEKVIKEEKGIDDVNKLIKKSFKYIIEEEKNRESNDNKLEIHVDDGDLRKIVKEGKNKLKSAYDTLKENGYIREINNEFLKVV